MNYESEVIDFLSQKENLSFVFEIADKVEKVREKLHLDFWRCLETKLHATLVDQDLNTRWIVKRDQDIFDKWSGVSLIPLEEPQILYLRPRLEQDTGSFRLYYGVHWSKEEREPITLPAVSELGSCLINDQFKVNRWWIGYKFTDIYPRSNDFLIRVSTNLDLVADDVASMFFSLIEKHILAVERANQSIREAANNGVPYP